MVNVGKKKCAKFGEISLLIFLLGSHIKFYKGFFLNYMKKPCHIAATSKQKSKKSKKNG